MIDKLKEKMEHRDALKWVVEKLKMFKNSNKVIDIDVKHDGVWSNSTTPLYFDRFDVEFSKGWLQYNLKFFENKLDIATKELEGMMNPSKLKLKL